MSSCISVLRAKQTSFDMDIIWHLTRMEKVNMEGCSQYNRLSCQLFGKPVVIIADIKNVHSGEDAVIEKKLFTNFDHQNNEKTVLGRCVVCYSFITQNEHQIMLGRRRGPSEQTNVLTELLKALAPRPNLDIPVEKEVFSVSSSWFCRNCSSVCQQLSSKSKQEPVKELRKKIIASIQLSMLIAEKQVNSAIKNEKDTDWNDHTSILLQTKAVDKIRECLINEIKLKYKRLPVQEKSVPAQVKVGDFTKFFNLVHHENVTVSKIKQQSPSTCFGTKAFACMQCGKGYAREQDLDTHLRYHAEVRLCCEFCDAKFISNMNLRQHVRNKHPLHSEKQQSDNQMSTQKESGGRIYKCDICGATLASQAVLNHHKRVIHLGIKPHACPHCQKRFATRHEMIGHSRRHTGEKPFACPNCGKRFAWKHALIRHIDTRRCCIRNAPPEYQPRKEAPCAPQKYPNRDGLTVPANESKVTTTAHKESGGGVYKCDICGAALASRATVNRHKRAIHFGIKQHACPHCQKRFGSRHELISHSKLHTGEKNFACRNCDRRFAWNHSLIRHLRICNKSGNCRSNRSSEEVQQPQPFDSELHAKVQKSRKYTVRPCNFCPKRFTTKFALDRHVKSHHPGFPVNNTSESEYLASVVKAGQELWKATEGKLYFCDLEIKKDKEGKWLCPLDNCSFSNEQRPSLIMHINRTHADISNYQCNQCELKFYYKFDLDKHVQVQHEAGYKCDICDEKLSNRDALNRHKSTKHGSNFPHVCKYCGKGFTLKSNLIKHKNSRHASHSGERVKRTHACLSTRQLECGQCDEKFYYRSQLIKHKLVHTGAASENQSREEAPQKDPNGDPTIPTKANQVTMTAYKCPEGGSYKCDICGATLASQSTLSRHKRVIHLGIKRHACPHCPKKFASRHKMSGHIRQHTGERPFACPNAKCDRRFAMKDCLTRHLLICNKTGNCQPKRPSDHQKSRKYTKVRCFPCNFCPRRFTTKFTLNKHVKAYHAGFSVKRTSECEYAASVVKAGRGLWKETEGKLYFCDLEITKGAEGKWLCPLDNCVYSNVQRPRLVIHINRTHADISNYQCNQCELKFYYEFDLDNHVQVQHEGGYKCDICDEKFTNRDALNRHKSTKHGSNFQYACKDCGKGFSIKYNLSKHIKSHHASPSGERVKRTDACLSTRQFECGQCNAKFYYRSQLIKHKLVHTDGPFACNFCDQRFALMEGLKRHVQEKHSDQLQLSLSEKDENEAGAAVEAVKDEPCLEDEEKVEVVDVDAKEESHSLLPEVLWNIDQSFDPFQIY